MSLRSVVVRHVAMCGGMQPQTGEFGFVRGVVRRNAQCRSLPRDREDDLAEVVSRFETGVRGRGLGQWEHCQR